VVEDSISDVSLLERMLENTNTTIEITNVRRLIDAFQCIDNQSFDVILLDLNLLDIDGVSSVAALAAEAPMTPVIVYSGMENRALMEKALLCGAKHYLVKGREDSHSLRHAINSVTLGRYSGEGRIAL